MPPYDRKPTPPPIGGFVATSEAAALWRAREEDRYDAEKRFDRMDGDVQKLRTDVTEVKGDVKTIMEAEERRTASAEKRNHKIWQVVSGVLVSLLVAIAIALWKVFAPIAIIGHENKPTRVIDTVDQVQDKLKGN